MTFCPTCSRRRTRDGVCGCAPSAVPPRQSAAPPPAPPAPPRPPAVTDTTERLRRRQANRTLGLVVLAAALVVTIGVLPGVIGAFDSDAPDSTAAADYYYTGPTVVTSPYTTFSDTTYPTETTTDTTETSEFAVSTPDTTGDPATDLRMLAYGDLTFLSGSFDGVWLPQLSSKRVGMMVDGWYYDDAAILADHLALRSSYGNVRLVWSGDWVTFSAPDFWVTLVAEPFASPEGANAWCDSHGIGREDCYAKRLSTTGSGDGNTRPR